MNPRKVVTLSNVIGIVSIFLLLYWVFIFVSMEVFGFRVFRENMTQTFYMSIFGIISLMSGALIINIMFNLTRIAQKHNNDPSDSIPGRRWPVVIFILSFPLVFILLFAGDKLTSAKKEKMLIHSAKSILSNQSVNISAITDYTFTRQWMRRVSDALAVMSRTDSNFNSVTVIVNDSINSTPVFLGFGSYPRFMKDENPERADFLLETNLEERIYLEKAFREKNSDTHFSSSDGHYELFFPVVIKGRVVVFYFSDRQRYGKIGS